MKILAILGSPRRNGNTEILLDSAIAGAKAAGAKVEKIILNELKFVPCQNCGGCDKTGICVIKDDMQRIYAKLKSSGGVILASPIYFGSVSAQAKAMIDRCQAPWVAKYVLKKRKIRKDKETEGLPPRKRGIFLSVSGSGMRKFFTTSRNIVRYFFVTNDIEYAGELYAPKAEKKGGVQRYPKALAKAYELGKELAEKC